MCPRTLKFWCCKAIAEEIEISCRVKVLQQKSRGTNDDVFTTGHRRANRALDPRHLQRDLVPNRDAGRETLFSPRDDKRTVLSLCETIIHSREQLEQVAGADFRKQLELIVHLYVRVQDV